MRGSHLENMVGSSAPRMEVEKFLRDLGSPTIDELADLDILDYPNQGVTIYRNK